jgi:prophage regulatory protein
MKTGKAEHASLRETCRLVDLDTVMDLTSLRRATIYAMVKDGEFPKPHKLGKRRIAWREADVVKWLQSRQAVEWAA